MYGRETPATAGALRLEEFLVSLLKKPCLVSQAKTERLDSRGFDKVLICVYRSLLAPPKTNT